MLYPRGRGRYFKDKSSTPIIISESENTLVFENYNKKVIFECIFILLIGFVFFVADVHDIELKCHEKQCMLTRLRAVNKNGLFGFLPKYYRSQVQNTLFDSTEIEDILVTPTRMAKRTVYMLELRPKGYDDEVDDNKSEKNDIKIDSNLQLIPFTWFSTENIAENWKFDIKVCFHESIEHETCHISVERSYFEEVIYTLSLLFFFFIFLCFPYRELVTLYGDTGTICFTKLSLARYPTDYYLNYSDNIDNILIQESKTSKKIIKHSLEFTFGHKKINVFEIGNRNSLDYVVRQIREFEMIDRVPKSCVKLKNECVICFSAKVSTILFPCGHACLCQNCSQQISACPLCRVKISSQKKIFLSN